MSLFSVMLLCYLTRLSARVFLCMLTYSVYACDGSGHLGFFSVYSCVFSGGRRCLLYFTSLFSFNLLMLLSSQFCMFIMHGVLFYLCIQCCYSVATFPSVISDRIFLLSANSYSTQVFSSFLNIFLLSCMRYSKQFFSSFTYVFILFFFSC